MTQELEWQTRKERIDKKLKSMNPPSFARLQLQ
jgi:hypothetical protein